MPRVAACVGRDGRAWLGLGAASASADIQRPVEFNFGPDGTTATNFQERSFCGARIGFDQVSKKLYSDARLLDRRPLRVRHAHARAACTALPRLPPNRVPHPIGRRSPSTTRTPAPRAGCAAFTIPGTRRRHPYTASKPNGTENRWQPVSDLAGGYPADYCWVEVDSNGNMAVSNRNSEAMPKAGASSATTRRVNRCNPVDTAKYQNGAPCYLAFDSHEQPLRQRRRQRLEIHGRLQLHAGGKFVEVEKGSVGQQMTIDKANDHLFMINSDGTRVLEYDPMGKLISAFGETYGTFGPAFDSLAVNEATNEVYVCGLRVRRRHPCLRPAVRWCPR